MSSTSLDADVNIILNAQDHASDTVDAATKRINTSYRQLRGEQRAVSSSFELQHRTLSNSLGTLQRVGSIGMRLLSFYNTFTLNQIRRNQILEREIDLQKELNKAIASGDFEEQERIQRQLNQTSEERQRLLREELAMYGFIALATLSWSRGIVKDLIPAVTRLRNTLGRRFGGVTTPTGGTTSAAPRVGGGLRIPGGLRALGGAAAAGPAIALWLAQLMGEQQAGGSTINPTTGQEEFTELPGGFDLIKDLLFKTDSSKKIQINVKVDNEQQSAEVDLNTNQVTYGQ